MPLYEFRCNCGPFENWRTIAEASKPLPCPSCKTVAKRIFSPLSLLLTSGTLRLKGSHNPEPQVVTRSQNLEPAAPRYQNHQHGRPWMINH